MKKMVVFSDLDGTLLDHDTYEWEVARPVLEELGERRVPLVLTSSKTLAEMAELRREMALDEPVVAENGAFIEIPDGYFPVAPESPSPPVSRSELQRIFAEIREHGAFDCTAFHELGDTGIAEATGLTLAQARLANRREASEPVLWRDTTARLAAFEALAAGRGLRALRGGRFVHLMGRIDKAQALAALVDAYRHKWPEHEVVSVALGDGPNDLGMLRAADIAVVIRGRHEHPMPLDGHAHVLRPRPRGPRGWVQAMRQLLDEGGNDVTNPPRHG